MSQQVCTTIWPTDMVHWFHFTHDCPTTQPHWNRVAPDPLWTCTGVTHLQPNPAAPDVERNTNASIYTHIHGHIHTYTHIYKHICIHTQLHKDTYKFISICASCICVQLHVCMASYSHIYTYMQYTCKQEVCIKFK